MIAVHGDRTQCRITAYAIDHAIALFERDLRVDQPRTARVPEQLVARVVDAGIGQGDAAMNLGTGHGVQVLGEQRALDGQPNAQAELRIARTCAPHGAADFPSLQVRRPADAIDARGRDPLEPYRLPDAGGARVPDRVRLQRPVLLAARLFEIERIVLGADHDLAAAVAADQRRDVAAEWGVTAFMHRDEETVDPNCGAEIHSAEVQQYHVAASVRHVREPPIPARAEQAVVVHAAGRRLRRKRHSDCRVPDNLRRLAEITTQIDREVPRAVQRGPLIANQLRPRVAAALVMLGHAALSSKCHSNSRPSTNA